jgi:hypothetical protein
MSPPIASRLAFARQRRKRHDLASDVARLRIAARLVERGQKTPGEHGSNLGVRNDAAPTSINSLVTGKDGDDGLNLI